MFLAVFRRFTSRKTRVVAPEMLGLTCRVGAHISRYAHDTRLYPMYMVQPPRDTTAAQLCIDGDDDVKQSLMILIDCNSAYSGMYENCRLYDFLRSHRLFDTNLLITLATRWRH